MLAPSVVNVIELAVQQVGLPDGADFDLAADPFGAAAGDLFLLQAVGQAQAFIFYLEGFFVGLGGVQRLNEAWFTEQELQRFDAVQLLAQGFVGIDGEISRYHGQAASFDQPCL